MAVQINVAANQAALTASIQAGVQAYNQRFAQNNQLNLTINPRAFSQPLGRITGDVKDFEAALAASNARVIAFGASTAVLGGVIRSFKDLANVTIEVQKNLADINRVFGLTTSQLQKFSTDLFNVTKQTASSFNDASQAALEFSRQGLKAEETLQRTKDALTLTRLAGISTANAVDALTSTVNGFSATGVTTTQILNKLVAVEQDFAVGAGDLAEALSRTGQAAQEAGVSLDQLNALVTSAQQSTARGGAVIGNALKTIFTRLQRTDTLDQLEAFNISVRDIQGNILPAVTILQNFAGAYKTLGDAQRAQLSEQVAGVYQVNILKAIVGDLNKSQGVYAGALQRGAAATNEAEIATAKLNQTLDALLKQTATSTQQLANNIGKVTFEPLAKYGTQQLKSFIETINEVLEGEGAGSTFANGLLKGIRNVIAGPGAIAAFFTLFKLIQNSFTYLSQALPQIAGITTETQNRKNIEQAILQIMSQQGPVAQALAGTMGNQAAQAQLLLQVARQQTAEYQTQTALARQLAGQLAGQGVRVRGAGGLQVTRAGGYIPASTKMAEVVGAQAGGYAPGRVVSSPVGGVMNTAEDVKYIPGFAQPFINPPANSKAGRAHRQKAINRTGIDPYMAGGFIPNFSNPKDVINKSFTGELNLLKITSNTEKEEIQKVADLESQKIEGKKITGINDKIVGTGIRYDTQEPKGSKTNEKYREEAAKLALYGKIDKIANAMPQNKKSFFNGKQWKKNLNTLKEQKIDLSNIAFLSTLKLKVPSLSTGENVKFGKQFTGLLNALSGEAFERDISETEKMFSRSAKGNARLDFISTDEAFSGGEAKLGSVTLGNLVAKAIESTGQKYDNGEQDNITFTKPIKLFVPAKHKLLNKGFIPNFAPPTSAIRVPWFKKFGNAAFDAVQPTLGISKANDTDTFRSSQFRSKAFEKAATDGDPNLFAPLYEDFVFKALQLTSQSKIKDQLIRGYVNQPGTDQKQSAFDAFLGDVAFEKKGFPKGNLTGSISKNLNDKFERYVKANPAGAAKIKESVMVFNELAHENQITSDFGKNFTQLAGTSYSQMLKNSPDLVKGLSTETNMLLNRYVKNPAFLSMSAAKGFIPNFNFIKGRNSFQKNWLIETAKKRNLNLNDPNTFSKLATEFAKTYPNDQGMFGLSKGFIPNFASMISSSIKGKGNISAIKTGKNDYEIEGVEVGKKFRGQGLGSQLYGNIAQKIGSGSTIKSVLLPQEQALADYASGKSIPAKAIFPQLSWAKMAKSSKLLINGKEIAMSDFESGIAGHKYNAAKLDMALIELVNSHASGFIPNFAYKQAVMGLEESMSGNKAIFDTKPFPHIRNSSQPTFTSAIADHGGLSNALTDSLRGQKAAGLMSGGFIPNFADSKIDVRSLLPNAPKSWSASIDKAQLALSKLADELFKNKIKVSQYFAELSKVAANNKVINSILPQLQQQLIQEVADKKRESRNKKIQSFGNTLAIAGPIVAGLLEQVLYGNKQRFEMSKEERIGQSLSSTGLTSVSTGASLGGSIGGLPGAIIGSLLGLGVAITSATQAAKLSAEELQSLADQTKVTTQNTVNFGQTYIEALKTFQTATDPEIIKKASLSLADSFQAIVDIDLQKQFKNAGDDISKLSKILFEYENSRKEIGKLQEERSLVQKLKPGSSELFLEMLGFSDPAKAAERKRAELLGTTNKNEIDIALVSRFSGLFSELSKLNKTQIEELQKTVFENGEDVNKLFEKITSFANQENKAVFSVEIANQISEIISGMRSSNTGASKGPTGNIPADIGFYTNLYRKQSASPNKLSPEQIQDQAKLTAAYKDLLQLTTLQVGFENDSFKLSQERSQIEQDYLNFLGKNLENKKGVLEVDYQSMKMSLETKKRISLKDKQSSIIENYLKFFETAPATKRGELEDKFINETALSQQSFIEKMPQTKLEFEKSMQEYMGASYNKTDLDALYEATQKFRAENENINSLHRSSLDMELRRFELAKRRLDLEQSFLFNLKSGYANLVDDGKELTAQLGKNLPRMFADGLVDGIKAAIKESDNLGEALMGIAAKFLDEISTTLMKSSMYQILGSVGFSSNAAVPGGLEIKQRGGVIRAQSGMYISGSGSGDKYPALLENGEYVLNRNAVMAMGGPSELDKLNFSMAPRFASGGSFATELNDLNSMEEGMTTYGLENSKLYNELRDAERAKQAEKRRKAFERKKMIAGIVGSVAGMAASFGIMKAAGSFGSSLKKDFGDVTMNVTPEQLAQNANLAQKGGHIGTRLSDTIPAYAEGGLYSSPIIKKYGVGMQNGGMYGGSSNNSNTVSNTNATNSFNFNTTVNRDGTIQMGADSTSYKQQDVELSNNLNSQVYKTVLDVIKQQQRFGGTLAGTRRPI